MVCFFFLQITQWRCYYCLNPATVPSAIILELLPTVGVWCPGTFLVFPINLWDKVPEPGGFQHELFNWQGLNFKYQKQLDNI